MTLSTMVRAFAQDDARAKPISACEGCNDEEPQWMKMQRINMTVRGDVVEQDSDRDEVQASEDGGNVIVAGLVIGLCIAAATLGAWWFFERLEQIFG